MPMLYAKLPNDMATLETQLIFSMTTVALLWMLLTYLCFGQDIDAANAPDFKQPLIKAMSDGGGIIIYFKHFPIFRKLIPSIPPERAMKSNASIAGLIQMQMIRN